MIPAFVVLLRGINVGGRNPLPMAGFRELLASLGCEDISTYIQSGNAVFRHSGVAAELSARISDEVQARFGLRISVLALSADEFAAVVRANPFAEAVAEPKNLHIWFLEEPAAFADMTRMESLAASSENWVLTDTAFYLHAPDGIGRSKLASNVEKCLAVPATARNWRTIGKIGELLADLA